MDPAILDSKRTLENAEKIYIDNNKCFLEVSKQYFIKERNKILDSILKYYNPYYRWKLKRINKTLDKIEDLLK